MKRLMMILTLAWALIFGAACSSFKERNPSSKDGRRSGQAQSEMAFTVFHTFTPTRKSGGEWIEIAFKNPKALTEISFEYINYRVKVHQVQLVTESDHELPVPALQNKFVRADEPFLIFEGLSPALKIKKIRVKVEGYEHNDVAFTLSLFSPDGFAPAEIPEAPTLRETTQHRLVQNPEVPSCYQRDPNLRAYYFNFEELNHPSATRHFCQRFVPEFKSFLSRHPEVARYLREGVRGVKPLLVVSQRFSYDPDHQEIFLPLQFQRSDFSRLNQIATQSRELLEMGLKDNQSFALDLDYESFMSSELPESRLSYADEFSGDSTGVPADYCIKNYQGRGVGESMARRFCQQVTGFEQGHFNCLEGLLSHHFPLSSAHSSCVEARGKWHSYLPCVKDLSEMSFSHYDSHQFCVRTPEDYIASQRECVRELQARDVSGYRTLRSCQKAWGREHQLWQCLDQRRPASQGLEQCLP